MAAKAAAKVAAMAAAGDGNGGGRGWRAVAAAKVATMAAATMAAPCEKTHGYARIARKTRAVLARPCVF